MKPTEIPRRIFKSLLQGVFLIILAGNGCASGPGPAPSDLRCELLTHPDAAVTSINEKTIPGICDAAPEFGWVVHSDISNDIQTAYQIMVAANRSLLDRNEPDLWDSGKVTSHHSVNVSYAGSALSPNQSCFWKVRTWNKADQVSDWSAVQEFKTGPVLSGHHTARYQQVVTELKPISVTKLADGHYLADFGKATFGFLRWTVPNSRFSKTPAESSRNQDIEFHLGEKLKDGRVDRNPGGTIRYYHKTITLDSSGNQVGDADEHQRTGDNSREYTIYVGQRNWIPDEFKHVGTYRYVEIVNAPFPVSQDDLTQCFLHNPFDDNAASFSCDNQTLNNVWNLCKYSIKETTWCGIFVDGDRERKPYEADAYIDQLGYYSVDTDFSIARYSHEYLMEHPTWPTEWKQHSIMMAWADYMYTGNSESLAAYYESLKNDKLLMNYARADGLIDPPDRDIVDWPAGERDGYDFKPINTVVNAFYYQNLLQMRQIAEVLGKPEDAADFRSKADTVYTSFQRVFYNHKTGLYVDGEGSTHSSLHANMWPLAFGLVPEDKKAAVAEYVGNRRRSDTERIACSVYGVQYLLEALYLSGREQTALEMMTNTTPTSWVNMMREGSTVTTEAWGIAYKPNEDWNHAWAAAPANIIPRFVAGIRPLEAGFAKALIHPQPGKIGRFSIKTPTIRGPILLSMNKQQGDCTFHITIPANMTAKFVLPKNCDDDKNILLDGGPAVLQQDGSLRWIDPIGSGEHVLAAH